MFSISACLLLVTFWLSVSTSPTSYQVAMKRVKIPIVILIVFIVVFELTADILRFSDAEALATSMGSIVAGSYIAVLLLVSIYFVVSGGLLLRKIRQTSQNANQGQYSIRRTKKIVICLISYSVFTFLTIVGMLTYAIPSFFASVPANYSALWCSWIGIQGGSLFMTISIRRPRTDEDGSRSFSSSTNKQQSVPNKANLKTASEHSTEMTNSLDLKEKNDDEIAQVKKIASVSNVGSEEESQGSTTNFNQQIQETQQEQEKQPENAIETSEA